MSRDWSYVGDAARLREAAEKALEAIETHGGHMPFAVYRDVKGALRAALTEPMRKPTCVYPQCVSTTRTTCDAWASGACEENPEGAA